jgi:hypothetical protein
MMRNRQDKPAKPRPAGLVAAQAVPARPPTDRSQMPSPYAVILFDIDGTLITSGGAGAASWRMAFDELHGVPADRAFGRRKPGPLGPG